MVGLLLKSARVRYKLPSYSGSFVSIPDLSFGILKFCIGVPEVQGLTSATLVGFMPLPFLSILQRIGSPIFFGPFLCPMSCQLCVSPLWPSVWTASSMVLPLVHFPCLSADHSFSTYPQLPTDMEWFKLVLRLNLVNIFLNFFYFDHTVW